jgi:uncharacterized protein YciI
VSGGTQGSTFLVEYHYVDDILRRREPVRDSHRACLQASYDRGELLFAGALQDPIERGVLILGIGSRGDALSWATADPVVQAGLVRQLRVHELATAYSRLAVSLPNATAPAPDSGH